jgi:two-component system, cell cycle response regulator DivK
MSSQPIPKDFLQGWAIVLIDNEEDSLMVAGHILRHYGADVHTAENGAVGLDLIRTVQPRFVISDLSMPVMDGWELIAKMKSAPAIQDIPVIALTAHAMVGDREQAIAAGFHNYLTKPLTASTFMHDLLKVLGDIPGIEQLLNSRQ